MKTTNELLQQLNTMQSEHIKVLEERIEALTHTIEIDKITIKTLEKTNLKLSTKYGELMNANIKLYLDNLNNKTNE